MKFFRVLFLLGIAGMGACTSVRMGLRQADDWFRERQFEDAAKLLKQKMDDHGETGRDRLLFLMDLGLVLHTAEKYSESNTYLLEAEKIADIVDYTSLSQETGTLLTSENVKDYKGEDFEKVLINAYLAMNFALSGNLEGAQIESRKVNRKLYLMISEGKRKYQLSPFASYLSAVLYEAAGSYDDAYIDYKRTYELAPTYAGLRWDLYRTAKLTRRVDDLEKWETQLQLTEKDRQEAMRIRPGSNLGEIVVLFENGIAPIKKPNPAFSRVPKFYPRSNPVTHARVEVDGAGAGETRVLQDIEATAIQNLDDLYAEMIAKRVAGVVVKEVVAGSVERATDNPLLGFITRVFFHASDQADLRSWNLLPKDLQIARIPVEPGTHQVRLMPVGDEVFELKSVTVKRGQKVFVGFRYVPR